MKLNLILDASGSLSENGKDSVARMLLLSARRLCGVLPDLELRAYRWREDIVPLPPDVPPDFSGRADPDALNRFLAERREEAALLLTDGGELPEKPGDRLFIVAVGGDCDRDRLGGAVGREDRVFPGSDLPGCLLRICCRKGEDHVC